ncbi:MAG: hypothetical protein Q7R86_03175, partial [bacterium]|nr:hypothetical protein [bacterium]
MDNKVKNNLISFLTIAITSVVMVFILSRITPTREPSPSPTQVAPEVNFEIIKEEVESSPDQFEKFFSLPKILSLYPNGVATPEALINACENPGGKGVKNPEECNKQIGKITKVVEVSSHISGSWLYVKAGVIRDKPELGPLNPRYDAVWFFLDDSENSGHLFVPSATESRVSSDGSTEILFKLDKVTFVDLPYSEKNPRNKREVDLEEIMGEGKHYIAAFVSSLAYGKIQDL